MGKSSDREKKKQESGAERFDTSKLQFRPSKKDEKSSKVVLDDRFASVLTDPRFQLDIKDKYGRKNKQSKKAKEDLSEFYTVNDGLAVKSEKEEQRPPADDEAKYRENDDEKPKSASSPLQSSSTDGSKSNNDKNKDSIKKSNKAAVDKDKPEDPASRIAYLTALSRGEIDVSSSSSEDEASDGDANASSDSDDDDGDEDSVGGEDTVMGKAGVLDPSTRDDEEIELTTQESPFLAVQNMDWSNVRAVDIFTILSSFTPTGAVKRVQVFPSDFGMERLAKEVMFGPVDVWKKKKNRPTVGDAEGGEDSDEDSDDAEAASYEINDDNPESDGLEENTDNLEGDDNNPNTPNESGGTDFDPEKLRAYEASRLKYFFAVVEFSKSEYADIAYKELDGMEFEHSSSAIDLRSIPVEALGGILCNRELRDEATNIPSNYVPPEFVVLALQQSNVQCTWDMGDRDRESTLTKYNAGQVWGELAEGDNLKAYVASDNSSDEESVEENIKASGMRKLLGLDSDDEANDDKARGISLENNSLSDSSSNDDDDDDEESTKEVSFIPGEAGISTNKVGTYPEQSMDKKDELTPWEKYQEKRNQKRRDKRHAVREKRKEVNETRKGKSHRAKAPEKSNDDFFLAGEPRMDDRSDRLSAPQSKEELALLVAGADNEVEGRNFDMRGLERLEKNKDKKLQGARKRKEEALAANVCGTEFKVDTTDARFKAVLDGSDDRFGIDRTDPNFRETSAMREILAEQTLRRKKKRKVNTANTKVAPDVSAESANASSGSTALSALVSSIKAKVSR